MTTGGWCARSSVRESVRVAPFCASVSDASQHTRVACPAARAKCLGEETQRRSRAKLGFPRPSVGAVSHRQSFSPPASREHASGVRSILECVHLVSTLSCPRSLTRYTSARSLNSRDLSHSCAACSVVARSVVRGVVLHFRYRCTGRHK